MAFTYDLTTDIGKVRLLISDSDVTSFHFTDEEILVFLDLGGSVLMGAAKALEAWAGSETDALDSERIGDYQYTRGAVSKKLTLAKEYRKQDSEIPYLAWAEMDLSGLGDTTIDEDIE